MIGIEATDFIWNNNRLYIVILCNKLFLKYSENNRVNDLILILLVCFHNKRTILHICYLNVCCFYSYNEHFYNGLTFNSVLFSVSCLNILHKITSHRLQNMWFILKVFVYNDLALCSLNRHVMEINKINRWKPLN